MWYEGSSVFMNLAESYTLIYSYKICEDRSGLYCQYILQLLLSLKLMVVRFSLKTKINGATNLC